jgi:hypothetical protein
MPGTVLRNIALWHQLYLTAKPSHVGGRCGRASLPSALSYDLQSSDEGIELPVRRCLVPIVRQWAVAPFQGGAIPRDWIFDGMLTVTFLRIKKFKLSNYTTMIYNNLYDGVCSAIQ